MKKYFYLCILYIAFLQNSLGDCPTPTPDGYKRIKLKVGCSFTLSGVTYTLQPHNATDYKIAGHTISKSGKGIYRKTRPWFYLHKSLSGVEGEGLELTVESGLKPMYPLYTGSIGSIFSVDAHPWNIGLSTCMEFEHDYWLVAHYWITSGGVNSVVFDLVQRLNPDNTQWNVIRRMRVSNATNINIPEIHRQLQLSGVNAVTKVATVRFVIF